MNERLPKFKGEKLLAEIERVTAGLVYISEIDADVEPVSLGRTACVDAQMTMAESSASNDVREINFETFFQRVTTIRDWFGNEEMKRANRFSQLKLLLETNLRDLKVYKIGRVRSKIYVVGLDANNDTVGIMTEAVET